MPDRRTLPVVVPAAGLLLLTVSVVATGSLPGEEALARTLLVDRGSAAEQVLELVSDLTDALAVVALAALVGAGLVVARRRLAAVVMLGGVLATAALNPALKALVQRDRPSTAPAGADLSTYAFPSGHTAVSAALVLGMVAACGLPRPGRARVTVVVAATTVLVAVAVAQLALGRHLPADVLAGWLEAAALVAGARLVLGRGPGRAPLGRRRRPAPAPPG